MLSQKKSQQLIEFAILNGGIIHQLTEKTIWLEFKQVSEISIANNKISFNHRVDNQLRGAFFNGDWNGAQLKLLEYKNSLNLQIVFKTNKIYKNML